MEEMIKELAIKYQHNGSVLMNVFEFADSIDKVCKAQRNACLRESDKFKTSLDIKIRDSERESIKNAEIERQDYE